MKKSETAGPLGGGAPRSCRITRWTLLAAVALLCPAGIARAALTDGKPLPVRILVDLSKSMFPGYRVPSFQGPKRYLPESPRFKAWFGDFVRSLKGFGVSRISVVGFSTNNRKSPADLRVPLGPEFSPDRYNEAATFAAWRHTGLETDLDRNLQALTRNFEGLVFLVTDNRVETSTATEERATETFFQNIKDSERYQAVHIYRYDLTDPAAGPVLSLAVYGFLVSSESLNDAAALSFDNRFKAPALLKVFDGRHVKLRPLDVKPVTLDVRFATTSHGGLRFVENEPVQLLFEAWITNNTLYTIRQGKLAISIKGSFYPRNRRQQREWGLNPLPNTLFKALPVGSIPEVPPGGKQKLTQKIVLDTRGIPMNVKGFWNWVAKACSGLEVEYVGTGSISARDLELQLTQEGFDRLAGIYGEESLRRVFRINEKRLVRLARPDAFPISFRLKGDPRYGLVVALVLALLAVPLIVGAVLFLRKAACRVRVGAAETFYNLRRFGSAPVVMGEFRLGDVVRGGGSAFTFRPAPPSPFFTIRPTPDPRIFEVHPREAPPVRLEVLSLTVSGGPPPKPVGFPGSGGPGSRPGSRY